MCENVRVMDGWINVAEGKKEGLGCCYCFGKGNIVF